MFFSLAGCISKVSSGSSFDPAAFIIKVDVKSVAGSSGYNSFTVGLNSGSTYHIHIDWGDGTSETFDGSSTGVTHAYVDGLGPHYISIKETTGGGLPRLTLGATDDGLKIKEVSQWGPNVWVSFANMFASCYNLTLTATDLPDTHIVADFTSAWAYCYNITGAFPLIDTSAATTLQAAWRGCSALTSFPLINTAAVVDFSYAWYDCYGLTSFPALTMGAVTSVNIAHAWQQCSGLTSFPDIDFIRVSTCAGAWSNCASLTSFNISSGFQNCIDFSNAWQYCVALTSFGTAIFSSHSYASSSIKFDSAFADCVSLTSSSSLLNSLFPYFDGVSSAASMFDNVDLSVTFYEAVLNTLATGNAPAVQNGVSISFGNSQYHIEVAGVHKVTLLDTNSWTIADGGSISSAHNCLEYCTSVSKTLYQIYTTPGGIDTGAPVYGDSVGRLYTGFVVDGPAACSSYATLVINNGVVTSTSSSCSAYMYSYSLWSYGLSTYVTLWSDNPSINLADYSSVSSTLWVNSTASLPANIYCPGSPLLANGQFTVDPVYGNGINIFTVLNGQVISSP